MSSITPTQLLYLEDTYCFTQTARIIEMRSDERGLAVILDRTIFYPQGGGQPTDTGRIYSDLADFSVSHVALDPSGTVWHYGTFTRGELSAGDTVTLEIDAAKRQLHARIHSAGHLLDAALMDMGSTLNLSKGFHFPEGPYTEGDGTVDDPETFRVTLEATANALIARQIPQKREYLDTATAQKRGIVAPLGKDVRCIGFGEYTPCGCGGTHVSHSGEIGHIIVRKIACKKGRTKISYSVA